MNNDFFTMGSDPIVFPLYSVAWVYAKDKRTLIAEELENNGSEQG